MMRAITLAFFSLMLSGVVLAAPEKLANPRLEARAVALQQQLRCLVCQGESLDESNAPLAADLRRLIRERVAAGDSDESVKAYLVARYGDFILMKPPVKSETYFLWFAPLGFLAVGGGVVALIANRARRRFRSESNADDHVLERNGENT
ncbi:MAG TPA: cytochrome c-type biogenesis protein [Rhizomicrobium sp.]|jgi:cytochrome c-type biogenesis protein CcmH|nr:cytochrome c-type biogenesis protein [Rhizomicrobium sp.]